LVFIVGDSTTRNNKTDSSYVLILYALDYGISNGSYIEHGNGRDSQKTILMFLSFTPRKIPTYLLVISKILLVLFYM